MAKITGIGGVFFKSTGDNKALASWYRDVLGLPLAEWGGAALKWPEDGNEDGGVTAWHVAASDTKWFAPSGSSFMINYRVDDLDGILARVQGAGGQVVGGTESHENGRFAWVMDPEGNKVELWEPRLWDAKNKGA